MSNSAVVRCLSRMIITLSLILGLDTSVAAQPTEGKILQKGKVIYINEITSFGKVQFLQYHVMYKERYYLCEFTDEAMDYFCNEVKVINEQ